VSKFIFFTAITPGTTSQLEHYIVSVLWQLYSAAVLKVRSVDPFGSTINIHGIRGYIYVIATLKFTNFLN